MVNYVCIGKGTTDENGVAHITHDCNGNPLSEPGYKGSGAGETLIVASLDKPVVSESVLSNVLSVSDVDNYSLLLSADKSIIQSSETSVLSATLKNNNIPLTGKTVEFTSEKVLKTLVGNGQTGSYGYLNDDYYLTVDDNCNYVAIGSSSGNWLKITPSTIFLNGNSPSYAYDNDYPIHVKNGILTYVDGNGDSQTVDVSNYNPLKALLFNSGCTFRWYSLYGVTDSTGVASVPYVGTGAGLQSVTAKYGTIVSEPSTVTDCVMYDKGILNDPNTRDIYGNKSANLDFQRTPEYSSIKSTGTTYAGMRINNIPSDCVVDFEVCQIGGVATDQIFAIVSRGAWKTNFALGWLGYTNSDLGTWIRLRYSFTEGSATMTSLDDSTKTHTRTFTGLPDALMVSTANTDNEVRFRNVKVYPL